MKRKIIPYNSKLKELAKQLRTNSTKSEIKLWQHLKGKQLYGYGFHRQKPLLNFIADFYCYNLKLVIELDGYSHQLEETFSKDILKEKELNKVGLHVLRFQDSEVINEIQQVINSIEHYIIEFEKEQKNKHTPNPSQEGK